MLVAFIRTIILYFVVSICIRLMGKRQMGELSPTELVISIMISNIAALPIEDTSISIISGLVPILVLVSLEIIVSYIASKNLKVRYMTQGRPKIVIENGVLNQKNLDYLRLSPSDILEEMHQNEIFTLSDVYFAVMETNGKISFVRKQEAQSPTNKDLGIKGVSKNPPLTIILNGSVIEDSLSKIGYDTNWLYKTLKEKNTTQKAVLIMTCDSDGVYEIINKEDK